MIMKNEMVVEYNDRNKLPRFTNLSPISGCYFIRFMEANER